MLFFLVLLTLICGAFSATTTTDRCNGIVCPAGFIFNLKNSALDYTYTFFEEKFHEHNLLFSDSDLSDPIYIEVIINLDNEEYYSFQFLWNQTTALDTVYNQIKIYDNGTKGEYHPQIFKEKLTSYLRGPQNNSVMNTSITYAALLLDSAFTASNLQDILGNRENRPKLPTHNVDIVILNTISIAFNDDEIYNRVTENFLSNETNPSHKGNHVIPVKNITDNTDWSQDYGIFSTTSQGSNFSRAYPFDRHTHPKTKAGIIIAVSIVAGLILVIFIGTTAVMYMWYKRKRIELLKEVHIGDLESSEDSVNWQIQFNDVDIDYENLIGKGSTSKVYRAMLKTIAPLHKVLTTSATSRFSNCPVAVKIPIDNSYEEIVINSKELEAYKVLKYHDNILSCLGWVQVDSRKCLVFDLAIGGDLRKCVMAMRGLPDEEFNEKEFLFIFKEICLGMAYMASCGMVHRDLAARNILLTADKRVKISDFGLCCDCDESFTYTATLSKLLPLRWLSLEALVDRVFSEKSDVWSFGVLMYEVFSKGVTPYMALSNAEIVEFLSSGQRLEPTALASEEISLVMLSCWNADVTLRPTFEELVRTFEQTLEKRSEHYGYLMA